MSKLDEEKQYKKRLDRNIVKYSWYKIFTKRVYLPLIAIQLVSQGQVTIHEIALIAIISSIVQFALQMPTGYLADKMGNRFSMILGAAISVPSPLFYVWMPDFTGGLIASVLFFGGYAFQSGAVEAFMHDTLKELKRDHDYSKVMGRAQSYGLIGNVVLIALIPATYSINTNLPFILGFISLVVMLWLIISFQYPKRQNNAKAIKNPFKAVRSVVTLQNITLFIFVGFMTGVANEGNGYRELLMQDVGVAVSLFGLFLAAASVLGAVLGFYIYVLDKLRPVLFYIIDLLVFSAGFIVIGFGEPVVIVASTILLAAYSRVRLIVYQSKLLADLSHPYKATLMSALNLFTTLGGILTAAMVAKSIGLYDYVGGHFVFGIAVFVIGFILWAILAIEHRSRRTLA
jgi:MFS family permease